MTPSLVLGSASKWRRAAFCKIFGSELFAAADIDEKAIRHQQTEVMTQMIARGKAEAIVARATAAPDSSDGLAAVAKGEGVLVCLDQIVRFEGEHREKPETAEVAKKFLKSYRAAKGEPPRWIEFVNGLCVYFRGRYLSSFEVSSLACEYEPEGGCLSDAMIDALIAKGECLGSAGAVVIEDPLFKVQAMRGTEESVTGLPVAAVRGLIQLVQMPPVKYCLFDMDGLLLNTESMYTIAQKQVCARYGKEFTWEVKAQLMGLPSLVAAQRTVDYLELPCSAKEFMHQRDELLTPLFKTSEFLPGARDLLYKLKEMKVPCALATSSYRDMMEVKTTLVREDCQAAFGENRTCGNELEGRGKPEPEIFLRAMKLLDVEQKGVDPATCLVFEDAPNGVEAGLAAGMQVCMVPDENLSMEKRGKAHLELPSLSWVPLEQLLK